MRFEVIVSLRFLREGRFQTLLTLAGVAVGVAVIVFLSALISGLQTSLVANTLGSQPHVVVRPVDETARRMVEEGTAVVAARVEKAAMRTRTLPDWPLNLERIDRVPGVTATSPIAAGAAFAVKGDVSKAVALLESLGRFLIHYPSYLVYVAVANRMDIFLHVYVVMNAAYAARTILAVVRKLGRSAA